MEDTFIIGVDIGGTNTDAVLVDQKDKIICAVKTTTTDDISLGFLNALRQLLAVAAIRTEQIKGVFLGTTHATNAILQKKDLFRVGVIRIAGQYPEALPVAFSWPQDLKDVILGGAETINGGWECHGGALTVFCREEAQIAVQRLLQKGVEGIAVVGVFSPLDGGQEKEVEAIVRAIAGDAFPLSLSYEIGGIGFIERENSTILNTALKRVMQQGFSSLQAACNELNLSCPLMITQNDGSLMGLERAIDYPILTISAGPTNSFIGGARLAHLTDALVVDIGGTSTDVGLVRLGYPIRSVNKSSIGGVLLNFPMPDVLSIALGGGSFVRFESDKPKIGPESAGKLLTTQALSFGGNELTLTDAALMMEYVQMPEADLEKIALSSSQGTAIFDQVKCKIEELVCRAQGECQGLPVILVGGGAGLLSKLLFQDRYSIPPYFNVANAYGAALAEFSGTVDTVVSLTNREEALEKVHGKARQNAIERGADPATLRLVNEQLIPYSYVPNQMARVIVRYSGKRSTVSSQ